MIDLPAVAALRAIGVHGSVVAAADALGFTPSAVSQKVKRLERQTGVALLERVGRGVVLTASGRHLVDAGTRVLDELERLEAGLHRQAGAVAGRLRLAAFSTAMRGLVAPMARALHAEHPDLVLALSECEPWETIELVATGRVELGLVHSWGDVALAIPEHLEARSIAMDVADVIVHCEHELARHTRLTPPDLADEPWIATPAGTICREWLGRMHDGTGRQPRIAHEALEFDSHLALVGAGLGIALVPRLGRAPLGPDLVALPVHHPTPTRDIVALHRRSMVDSPAVAAVESALTASAESHR
jgi:DNA-binding transcriptional LysR family regulator